MVLFNNISNSWNKLGGNDVIDKYEKGWREWNVDDTVQWFEFIKNKRIQSR